MKYQGRTRRVTSNDELCVIWDFNARCGNDNDGHSRKMYSIFNILKHLAQSSTFRVTLVWILWEGSLVQKKKDKSCIYSSSFDPSPLSSDNFWPFRDGYNVEVLAHCCCGNYLPYFEGSDALRCPTNTREGIILFKPWTINNPDPILSSPSRWKYQWWSCFRHFGTATDLECAQQLKIAPLHRTIPWNGSDLLRC